MQSIMGIEWCVSFLILSCVLPLAADAAGDSAYNRGVDSYAAGNYDDAARAFSLFLAANNSDGSAHYYLANAYLKLNEIKKALEHYKQALKLCTDVRVQNYCRESIEALSKYSVNASPNQSAEIRSARLADDYNNSLSKAFDSIKNQALSARPPGTFFTHWNRSIEQEESERRSLINDSAQSVTRHLANDASEAGFHMVPQGTNLYVQNFSSPADVPLEQLMATPQSLTLSRGEKANEHALSNHSAANQTLKGTLTSKTRKFSVGD